MDTIYSSINIYNALKMKYREYLKPEIISVAIIQSEDSVWLESVETEIVEGGFEKQTTKRIDLDFISSGGGPDNLFFNPHNPIEKNVRKFLDEFGQYSIINTLDLFTNKAAEKINQK